MGGVPADGRSVWRRVLTVAWCSVLLGLAVEIVLVAIAAAGGSSKGLPPILADTVQKVSWSFLVCTGIACGGIAARRSLAMGVLGLAFGPIGFTVARAAHKAMTQALSITPAAGTGPSPYGLAAIKGVEYGLIGAVVGWIASRGLGMKAHLLAGAAAGIVFGGWTIAWMIRASEPALAGTAVAVRTANELLFPVGCSFVLYVANVLEKRLR